MKKSIIALCVILSGCATTKDDIVGPQPDDERYAPPEINYSANRVSNGSMFVGHASLSLFQDRKAYRVGDILTVSLDEKTTSNKSASSAFDKNSSASVSAPVLGSNVVGDFSGSLGSQNAFDGSSKANQGNSLKGSITVTVHEVYPNGVIHIVGEKWLKLNQGDEYIRLSGNVRVEDIDANNNLSSTRIADARITYAGKGVQHNATEPGWFMKMLNSTWMPF
ncbi:flagellar basal body L-ring protein FlgH [Vibrio barjaei]|uniref:flagellar basal body L-ring protein FlgH n=1 Tax=Vibrio barjaei TaxID=1676683 RepID=UPI00228435C1|nr:flagellar basal body L-ring protein FlgH [Vibrio barjaei]MCY9872314.1 flagellar basal body L-ring protein FlgH [Vibrio barjaei]